MEEIKGVIGGKAREKAQAPWPEYTIQGKSWHTSILFNRLPPYLPFNAPPPALFQPPPAPHKLPTFTRTTSGDPSSGYG